jgi:hypothetical protein
MEEQFKLLAKSYQEWLQPRGFESPYFVQHPVFFATVDVMDVRELFLAVQQNQTNTHSTNNFPPLLTVFPSLCRLDIKTFPSSCTFLPEM